jgi:hypothetical protein
VVLHFPPGIRYGQEIALRGYGTIRLVKFVLLVLAAGLAVSGACRNIDVVTNSYATLAEAQQAGAMERGWIPKELPPGAHDIREAHDLDSNRRWGLFNFHESDAGAMRAMLQPEEITLAGASCDIPGRVEWWPVLLRNTLDPERIKAAGLQSYRSRNDSLIVVLNWNQRRAYYWSR